MKVYTSNAKWPPEAKCWDSGENTTTDKHNTKEEAQGVCLLLELEGWGGEGKIFPLVTWVTEIGCNWLDEI